MSYGFSKWSWRRASGFSAAKGRISRTIGIPLTRSGRERKVGRMVLGSFGGGGRRGSGGDVTLSATCAVLPGMYALLVRGTLYGWQTIKSTYANLPNWAQPIVWGLGIASPLVIVILVVKASWGS